MSRYSQRLLQSMFDDTLDRAFANMFADVSPATRNTATEVRLTVDKLNRALEILRQPRAPRLYESDLVAVQYRFPAGKNRRIRRKWAKRPENWKPYRGVYLILGDYFCHPHYAPEIRRQLAAAQP